MNIAFVGPDGLSIDLFCKGIIRILLSIPGARVVVICEVGQYHGEISQLGAECVSVPMFRWFSPIDDIKYTYRLWRIFRRYKCDTVLNFCTKQNIYGTFAAKLAGVSRIYLHVVGLGSGFEKRKNIRGKIMRLGFFYLYRFACHLSNKAWFTNGNDRRFFVDNKFIDIDDTVLTRNYLNTTEYSPDLISEQRKRDAKKLCELKPGERVVVMVARMIWQKGIREFVESAEILLETLPNLKFILVAPLEVGSQDAVPESYVREKEKNANFLWLGFQTDVKRLYAISDLAVLPTFYKEGGYPRALLEPMAMRKPVITTNSDDCRGAVEDGKNGFLVPIQDSAALAGAIARVMSDCNLRAAMGTYSYEKVVDEFDERSIVFDALLRLGLLVKE